MIKPASLKNAITYVKIGHINLCSCFDLFRKVFLKVIFQIKISLDTPRIDIKLVHLIFMSICFYLCNVDLSYRKVLRLALASRA